MKSQKEIVTIRRCVFSEKEMINLITEYLYDEEIMFFDSSKTRLTVHDDGSIEVSAVIDRKSE